MNWLHDIPYAATDKVQKVLKKAIKAAAECKKAAEPAKESLTVVPKGTGQGPQSQVRCPGLFLERVRKPDVSTHRECSWRGGHRPAARAAFSEEAEVETPNELFGKGGLSFPCLIVVVFRGSCPCHRKQLLHSLLADTLFALLSHENHAALCFDP